MKPYRLYATTQVGREREHTEGPYEFSTLDAALAWVKKQRGVTVVEVTVWHKDEIVAHADARPAERALTDANPAPVTDRRRGRL